MVNTLLSAARLNRSILEIKFAIGPAGDKLYMNDLTLTVHTTY
jgi:hypothetical protein